MLIRAILKTMNVAVAASVIFYMGGLVGCSKTQTPESLLSEAIQYQQKGNNQAAIIQLKNALQESPDIIESRYLLGTIYNDIGDFRSAEKELRKAMSLGMEPAKVLPDIAKSLLMQGKFKNVLDETNVLSASKFDAALSVLRGNANLALGNSLAAKEIFELVLKERVGDPGALIGLSKYALLQMDKNAALAYAEQASSHNPKNKDVWLFKGDLFKSLEKFEPAMAAYDQVLQMDPTHSLANISKALININDKKFDAAKANIEAARKSDPAHISLFYTQAVLDFSQGKYSLALDSVQQVLRVAPEHMPSVILAGAIQLALGSLAQAEQHLKKFLEQHPDHLYARKLLVSTLLKSGQTTRAISTLAPALQDGKQDAHLLVLAGESYMQAKDFTKATEYFEKASLIEPQMPQIHTSLAMSKLGQGDSERAIVDLEKAVSLDTKSPQAGILLAMTHLRREEYDKALVVTRTLEKEQPDNPIIQNLQGVIFLGKKDLESARIRFLKALTHKPDFYPAAENLAKIDLHDKKPALAKKRFTDILEKDNKSTLAMTALAKLSQAQGQTAEATTWLEKAHKVNPDVLLSALLLTDHYLRIGEKSKALALAQTLQVNNPSNPGVLEFLAQAQMVNGKQSIALETYHKLSVLLPASARVQLLIANAHMSMQNLPAATDALKKALSLEPQYLDAQLAQATLELRKGNFSGVLLIAKKIQQQKATSALGYAMEGDVLMAQKKSTLAIPLYERAFSLDKNPQLLSKLHTALKQAGKGSDADSRVMLWLKDHPEDLVTRMHLADSYVVENKNKEAIAQYQAILQRSPNTPAVLNNLAWAYFQEQDSRALEYAEKAHQYAADNPAVLDTLGWILVSQGNAARGLALLQKAMALAPENSDIRYHLAQALVASGDKVGARKELEKLLATGKTFPDKEAAKTLLKQL